MDVRPTVNDLVVLWDRDDRDYRSRVEDIGPDWLTVAMPLDVPVSRQVGVESEIRVTWSTSSGMAVVPTRVIDEHVDRELPVWQLAVTGRGWVEQRRNFVRVPAHGPLTLRFGSDQPEDADIAATLVEISEAALRCVVNAAAVKEVADGDQVRASFRFGDGEFAVPARIFSRSVVAQSPQRTQLVVTFDEPIVDGDALRKQIFAQQLRSFRTKDGPRSGH